MCRMVQNIFKNLSERGRKAQTKDVRGHWRMVEWEGGRRVRALPAEASPPESSFLAHA